MAKQARKNGDSDQEKRTRDAMAAATAGSAEKATAEQGHKLALRGPAGPWPPPPIQQWHLRRRQGHASSAELLACTLAQHWT